MDTIGKYRIQRVLGRGGMGTVYEALDPLLNRKVALKTMIPGLADNPDLRARFFREAQAAGGLQHRNIVTVYDLGEDRGQPFIAMEFIEGIDLEKIIQKKLPYSIEWKIDVIRQVCDGLAYAHKSGIVHRDIKPANIRVTPEGEVKIMDFGIAHLQSSTLTRGGLVLGTIHYMAPEQIEGRKVDHRADIFSVGVIGYELIAYRKPFEAESLTGVMFKVTHEPPDAAGLPRTDYSPGLEAIVLKALARELDQRYQTLEEMYADLEHLVRETAPKLLARPGAPAPLPEVGEAARPGPGSEERLALVADLGKEERAARLVEEGRRRLEEGDAGRALECAREALALIPGHASAQELAGRVEAEGLRKRAERETAEIRAEMERARSEGQLQKALSLCRRLLERGPEEPELARTSSEIQAAIKDREVEQLCGLALSYAADGDTELALKIAGKIERLAPQSPRYLELKAYLEEESARRAAEALTATAQDHLALGNLTEALAAAEEALGIDPSHATAREIRDRVSAVLEKAAASEASRPTEAGAEVTPSLAASVASRAASAPSSEAEGPWPAAAPAGPAPTAVAVALQTSPLLPDDPTPLPLPDGAAPLPPPDGAAPPPSPEPVAVRPAPVAAGAPARRAEVESLTTAALNHFVRNEYAKARKAVEKALALDPQNRKATELLKILVALS